MTTETDTQAQPRHSEHDRDLVAAIRAELPATQARIYLNTGTNGPLPRRSHAALVACAEAELEAGRIGPDAYVRVQQNATETRAALAALLGCEPSEVALTHNTTEGMNIAVMGLDWRPGDEVITATTEHPGGLYPAYLLRQRYGVKVRMTEIGLKDCDPVAALRAAITPRTRAVVLSHVSWATGIVLPLAELAELTHRAGALLIVDAAQSCGMVPAHMYELGVDAYACSGQKWLCGPDGTGALFVRRDRWGDIQQTFMGYVGVRPGMSDHNGYYVPADSARRYEVATLYPGGVKALGASLRWIADDIGWEWAYQRIATLGQYCYQALAALDGVTLFSPPERMAGLIHFRVPGIEPVDLTAKLGERGILLRHTPYPVANRVATGFYNTEDEIDQLVAAIQQVRASL